MNVERWAAKRRPVWQKLEDLLRKVDKRGLSNLSRDDLQAIGRLYRSSSADLSRARALNLGSETVVYLNNLVVKAHNQVYQRPRNRWLDFFNFFYATFPSLCRKYIAYIAVATAIFWLPALASWHMTMNNVEFAHMEVQPGKPIVPEHMWDLIEQGKLWTDSVADASPAFTAEISTNNIRVCILCFALSITAGLGTIYVLFLNGLMLGTVLGACQQFNMLPKIVAFIVGHGSLELPAIFISGGAGLLLGSALLFPGRYRRTDAFKRAARPAFGIFAGCVPLLLIAGAIESFVSPRTDLPPETKFAVGVAAFFCLLIYLFVPRQPLGEKAPEKVTA